MKKLIEKHKNLLIIQVIISVVFLAIACGSIFEEPQVLEVINYDNWEIIWEEKFDSTALDTTYWAKIPRGKIHWSKYMSNHENCFNIKDSYLTLKGINNTLLPNDTVSFLTGGIWTYGKKTITYGKVEVRAKINKVQGAWPAIWLQSEKNQVYGEIDIMESINHDNFIYQTLHSTHTLKKNNHIDNKVGVSIPDKSEFNTYGVIINEDEIIFLINNKITFIYKKDPELGVEQFPYGNIKHLRLSMQLNNLDWTGEVNTLELPAEMTIDWVRFYEKKDPSIPDY